VNEDGNFLSIQHTPSMVIDFVAIVAVVRAAA
jgi:hypothetical protein